MELRLPCWNPRRIQGEAFTLEASCGRVHPYRGGVHIRGRVGSRLVRFRGCVAPQVSFGVV